MRQFLIIAVFVLLFGASAFAQESAIDVDLASDHVDITTGFNGTYLQLFGVRRDGGDIVVIVRGPSRKMIVWEKKSVFGAWINRDSETFKDMPVYYNYAVSRPVEEIASSEVLKTYGIAPENLSFNSETESEGDEFSQALVRNKRNEGLYAYESGTVKFVGPDFFRADFYIAPNVPVGQYEVQTLSFMNGELKEIKTNTLRVAQVGASAQIIRFAHKQSFIYGVVCVFLAIFAGWISNRIRRGS